jgi:hypothetical protein
VAGQPGCLSYAAIAWPGMDRESGSAGRRSHRTAGPGRAPVLSWMMEVGTATRALQVVWVPGSRLPKLACRQRRTSVGVKASHLRERGPGCKQVQDHAEGTLQ